MKVLVRWVFEQTRLGKLLNNYKTHLGFSMYALAVLINALLIVVEVALETFPQVSLINQMYQMIAVVDAGLSEGLKQAGVYIAGVGVWHDKLKRAS